MTQARLSQKSNHRRQDRKLSLPLTRELSIWIRTLRCRTTRRYLAGLREVESWRYSLHTTIAIYLYLPSDHPIFSPHVNLSPCRYNRARKLTLPVLTTILTSLTFIVSHSGRSRLYLDSYVPSKSIRLLPDFALLVEHGTGTVGRLFIQLGSGLSFPPHLASAHCRV